MVFIKVTQLAKLISCVSVRTAPGVGGRAGCALTWVLVTGVRSLGGDAESRPLSCVSILLQKLSFKKVGRVKFVHES